MPILNTSCSLLNKVAGRKAWNLIEKWLQHRCFPKNFVKNIYEHLSWRTSAYSYFRSDFRTWLFRTFFLDSRFQNHSDLVILQKHQSLSNQSFKHNSVHITSLSLTPTFSFEPRFRMFIINGYDRKSKCL